MLRTHNNTDGNKLVIFSGIALYYGDNYMYIIICGSPRWKVDIILVITLLRSKHHITEHLGKVHVRCIEVSTKPVPTLQQSLAIQHFKCKEMHDRIMFSFHHIIKKQHSHAIQLYTRGMTPARSTHDMCTKYAKMTTMVQYFRYFCKLYKYLVRHNQ